MQCLNCLEGGLDSYSHMTEISPINDVKDLSIIGMDLHALMEHGNKILGGLIVVDYGTSMLGIVIGIFFSLSMTNVVQEVSKKIEYDNLMQQAISFYRNNGSGQFFFTAFPLLLYLVLSSYAWSATTVLHIRWSTIMAKSKPTSKICCS